MKDELFQIQKLPTQQMIIRDPSAIAAAEGAKARIQAAYIMALQKPRSEDQARARILNACRRPEFAAKVEFSKPIGNRTVVGPSIRFAELALREWQNVDSDIYVVYEDETTKRIKIRVLDLETNAAFSKEISINKTVERKNDKDREVLSSRTNSKGETVYIVKATEDELNNKESAMISKVLRNEGLRLIPGDIVDEARRIAKETQEKADAADPTAGKKAVVDAFSTLNILPVELEKYLGHKLDVISPAELQQLRSIYTAISSGEGHWSEYLEVEESAASKAKKNLEELKQKISTPPPAPVSTQAQTTNDQPPTLGEPTQSNTSVPTEPETPPVPRAAKKEKDQKKPDPVKTEENPELKAANEYLSNLISSNHLLVKAALLNAHLSPKLVEFQDLGQAAKFKSSWDKMQKNSAEEA